MDGRFGSFETIVGYPKRKKEESTKEHEGQRRATKGLEKAPKESASSERGKTNHKWTQMNTNKLKEVHQYLCLFVFIRGSPLFPKR